MPRLTVLLALTMDEGRALASRSPGTYDLVVTPRGRGRRLRGKSVGRVDIAPAAIGAPGFDETLESARIAMATESLDDIRWL